MVDEVGETLWVPEVPVLDVQPLGEVALQDVILFEFQVRVVLCPEANKVGLALSRTWGTFTLSPAVELKAGRIFVLSAVLASPVPPVKEMLEVPVTAVLVKCRTAII